MRWNHSISSANGFALPVLYTEGIIYPDLMLSSQETTTSHKNSKFEVEEKTKLLTQEELNDLLGELLYSHSQNI